MEHPENNLDFIIKTWAEASGSALKNFSASGSRDLFQNQR